MVISQPMGLVIMDMMSILDQERLGLLAQVKVLVAQGMGMMVVRVKIILL